MKRIGKIKNLEKIAARRDREGAKRDRMSARLHVRVQKSNVLELSLFALPTR